MGRDVQPAPYRAPGVRHGGVRAARAGRGGVRPGQPAAAQGDRQRPGGGGPRGALRARAVAGDSRFWVSRVDADVAGRSYTVDTLRRLHESSPADELTFIMGGDMAHALPTWHEPEQVLSLATLGVAEREGSPRGHRGAPRRASRRRPESAFSTCLVSTSHPRSSAAASRTVVLSVTSCPTPWPSTSPPKGCTHERSRASAPIEPSELAGLVSGYASDVKAQDIVELDLRGVLGYTDYFVIATGGTDRQVKAVHDRIHENMKKDHGLLPRRVEGLGESRWILMDYLDVIVHVFTAEAREYYRLEQLWGEAPKRHVDSPAPPRSSCTAQRDSRRR